MEDHPSKGKTRHDDDTLQKRTLTGHYVSEKIRLIRREVSGHLDSKLLPASA